MSVNLFTFKLEMISSCPLIEQTYVKIFIALYLDIIVFCLNIFVYQCYISMACLV